MSNFNPTDMSHNPYTNLQSTSFQNTMQDFAKVESLVQAQTAGVNVGWPNTVIPPTFEGEFSQQYTAVPQQNQPVFINTPVVTQPPISLTTPTHYFQSSMPVHQAPAQLSSAPVSAPRQAGNPFHINPRLYRFVVPKGTYHGNDQVKKFLAFFNELNHGQRSLINSFMAFQFEKITTKIADQHNKEVQSLKDEITTLKDQLKERPTLDELESNSEMTTTYRPSMVMPWDTLSIQRLIDDDLTTLGGYAAEEEDYIATENTLKPPIPQEMVEEDIKKLSFRATTDTGFAKVRAGRLPHFDDQLIAEVKRLSALSFLTSIENRENGDAFYLLAGLIKSKHPQASFSPLVINKTEIMRVFSKFKEFKKQNQ